MTFVDRATRCIVGWRVEYQVNDELLQAVADDAPQADWYYSDELAAYQDLAFDFGIHFAMPDKSQTYSVEGDNAELRHYLARLGRKSRCFSRCIDALRAAVRLFVFCWNHRQLYMLTSNYPSHLFEFVSPAF
jgi:insertion element IS1 protein InsB